MIYPIYSIKFTVYPDRRTDITLSYKRPDRPRELPLHRRHENVTLKEVQRLRMALRTVKSRNFSFMIWTPDFLPDAYHKVNDRADHIEIASFIYYFDKPRTKEVHS